MQERGEGSLSNLGRLSIEWSSKSTGRTAGGGTGDLLMLGWIVGTVEIDRIHRRDIMREKGRRKPLPGQKLGTGIRRRHRKKRDQKTEMRRPRRSRRRRKGTPPPLPRTQKREERSNGAGQVVLDTLYFAKHFVPVSGREEEKRRCRLDPSACHANKRSRPIKSRHSDVRTIEEGTVLTSSSALRTCVPVLAIVRPWRNPCSQATDTVDERPGV